MSESNVNTGGDSGPGDVSTVGPGGGLIGGEPTEGHPSDRGKPWGGGKPYGGGRRYPADPPLPGGGAGIEPPDNWE